MNINLTCVLLILAIISQFEVTNAWFFGRRARAVRRQRYEDAREHRAIRKRALAQEEATENLLAHRISKLDQSSPSIIITKQPDECGGQMKAFNAIPSNGSIILQPINPKSVLFVSYGELAKEASNLRKNQ